MIVNKTSAKLRYSPKRYNNNETKLAVIDDSDVFSKATKACCFVYLLLLKKYRDRFHPLVIISNQNFFIYKDGFVVL